MPGSPAARQLFQAQHENESVHHVNSLSVDGELSDHKNEVHEEQFDQQPTSPGDTSLPQFKPTSLDEILNNHHVISQSSNNHQIHSSPMFNSPQFPEPHFPEPEQTFNKSPMISNDEAHDLRVSNDESLLNNPMIPDQPLYSIPSTHHSLNSKFNDQYSQSYSPTPLNPDPPRFIPEHERTQEIDIDAILALPDTPEETEEDLAAEEEPQNLQIYSEIIEKQIAFDDGAVINSNGELGYLEEQNKLEQEQKILENHNLVLEQQLIEKENERLRVLKEQENINQVNENPDKYL